MSKKKSNQRKILTVVFAVAVIALLLLVFAAPQHWFSRKPVKKKPVIENPGPPVFTKEGELEFLKPDGSSVISLISIEVADNNEERTRGLMYRKSMPDSCGMLFIFEQEQIQSFWMKNTYIPLDIIFVSADFRVVSISKNTKPLSESSIASLQPAKYVVEVNAGYADKTGIFEGCMIKIR